MAYLDNTTQKKYYEGLNFGNYQFCSLEDIINQFIAVYTGEDKLIPRARRVDVAFHAQRALAELSFDTFKSIKSQQIDIPPSLSMILPHDYVNYTKVSRVDSAGIKHPLYPIRHTSNPFQIMQDTNGQYVFDPDAELIVNNNFDEALTSPWNLLGQKSWESPPTVSIDVNGTATTFNTGFDGIEKGSTISVTNSVASFNHSSHGYGSIFGRALVIYQEVDVSGIDYLDMEATATTQAATTTTWNLTDNTVKYPTSDGTTATDLTIGGYDGFWDGYEEVISAYNIATDGSHDITLLSSDTNSALFDDIPNTTMRVGFCTQITDEMIRYQGLSNTVTAISYPKIIDTSQGTNGYDANGDAIYLMEADGVTFVYDLTQPTQNGQPVSPLASPAIFDLTDRLGNPSYKEWKSGINNNTEKILETVNVAAYDTIYFIAVSLAPFQGHAYTGELGTLTAKNTLDNISVKTSGATVLKSPKGNKVESSTWKAYKSGPPSENNNNDYEDNTYWHNLGGRFGLDATHAQVNGSFYIDDRIGKINFSSNISGKTVILDYISDSLGTEAEMKVHKLAEEAMYNWIAYGVLCGRSNIPEYIINRFQKKKFAETRKAKLRLSNIKLEEITQVLRGKSKHLKH